MQIIRKDNVHIQRNICVWIYAYTHTQTMNSTQCISAHFFWIVLDLFGLGTKARFGRRGSELGFAAGTAILCAEIMSSNGRG